MRGRGSAPRACPLPKASRRCGVSAMRDPREFPPWLPPLVREQAHVLRSELLRSGTPDDIAVLERLTGDPRMEAVWTYLQKRRRVGYRRTGYEHAPLDPMAYTGVNRSSFPTRAAWMQQLAMRALYIDIIAWGRGFAAPSSPRHPYHADADESAAKDAGARTVEELPRYLAAMIAGRLHELFGKQMYGQAATVAGLIMERDVTLAMVREAVALCGTGRKKQR